MKAIGLKRIAEDYNDKHMEGWQELCKAAGVSNTHLTPHIDAELLSHNHLACVARLDLLPRCAAPWPGPQSRAARARTPTHAPPAGGFGAHAIRPLPHAQAHAALPSHMCVHACHSCDGSLIESTGFAYSYPQLTATSLREQVDAYIAQGLFPPLG